MAQTLKGNYWLKSGILNVLQNMSGVLFGFGSFFFLVRLLSDIDYGIWAVFMATTTIFNVFRDGLLRSAIVKFLSGASEEDKPKIITSSFTIDGALTLCMIIINLSIAHLLAGYWDSPQVINLFYLYNIVYVLSGILTQFNCIEQANLQFDGIFVTNTANQGIFFAVVFVCFTFNIHIDLYQLVIVQIIANLISAFIAYFYVRKYLVFARGYFKEWINKLFNYGKYAFGTSVSSILSGTIDQQMLAGIISPVASGAFSIAVRIVNLIDIPTNAIATIVFPQSAKRMETEGKTAIKYLYEKSVGTILAILIPSVIFIFIFTDLIVFLIAGEKHPDTVPLLRVALLYSLLIPFGRQFGTILDSIGRTKTTFYLVVFTASFNLILNYFLITSIGIMGAAYATLVSNIVGFIIGQRILKKELNVNVWNTFKYAYEFYPEFYKKFARPQLINYKIIKEKI
jgi:lipopolysaccharide exporter